MSVQMGTTVAITKTNVHFDFDFDFPLKVSLIKMKKTKNKKNKVQQMSLGASLKRHSLSTGDSRNKTKWIN